MRREILTASIFSSSNARRPKLHITHSLRRLSINFFHSSLLLSSAARMLRYNCMVPFNTLVQLCWYFNPVQYGTSSVLVAATIKAVSTNISFYKYFHPFTSSFFNSWSPIPPWNKYLSLFPFPFTPPSTRNQKCFWNKSTLSSFILILLFKLIEHWTEVLDHKVYDSKCREYLV